MKTWKKLLAFVTVAALAFSMIACGETNTDGSSEATEAQSGEEAKGGELLIGASGPLTGDASSYGISVKKGAELAVEEINKAGGVNGMTLKFEILDDKAAAAEAGSNYDALYDKGMKLSLGAVTSGSCEAFGKRAAEDNLFFITPSASAASVIETGDTAFRVCFGDPDQGILAAEELTKNFKKIGCIYDTSDTYSSGIYEAFDEKMKELNAEYTTYTFDADNKKDFSAQVEGLKDCDVIFLPIYYTEAGLIARACAAKELNEVVLFGCDGFDGVANQIDETIKNTIKYITPFDVNSTEETSANFVKAFGEKYEGEVPDQFAADGYDAVYAIKAALEKAGVNDVELSVEEFSAKVIEAITAADFSLQGVTGKMTWDKTGACTKVPVIVELNK